MALRLPNDPVEYPPADWNRKILRKLIHIDVLPADLDNSYRPYFESTGDIASTESLLRSGQTRAATHGSGQPAAPAAVSVAPESPSSQRSTM
jgi:hypothetical protein